MNYDTLKNWIVNNFWDAKQVAGWANREFFRRAIHRQTSDGTVHAGLPVILDAGGKLDASLLDGEDIADTVGAMLTGNTETDIAVTYQDSDNTIDFVVSSTLVGDRIHAASSKATPVDADELGLVDSAASNVLKKLTWANLKATLKTYFDTLYPTRSESTWTPEVWDAASAGNQGSATAATGFYIKHGKVVTISCLITDIDTTGLTAGNTLFIRGLPFSGKSTANYRATAAIQMSNVTFSGYAQAVLVHTTPAAIRVTQATSGGAAASLNVSAFTSGTADVVFSMTYWTD